MTETGWPLIPREALPASLPPARHPGRPEAPAPTRGVVLPSVVLRQLPMFGADTADPSPADLAGLLAGPGRLDRMGGTARVTVHVDAAWRVHVLVRELVVRGLVVTWRKIENPISGTRESTPLDASPSTEPGHDDAPADPVVTADPAFDEEPVFDDQPGSGVIGGRSEPDAGGVDEAVGDAAGFDRAGEADVTGPGDTPMHDMSGSGVIVGLDREGVFFEVRTAYARKLIGLANGWPVAAPRLFLDGPRLRLWVAAAGTPHRAGYALGLDPLDDPGIVDAALTRAGLAGTIIGGGRSYLITGRKRLRRLAELVGEPPAEAPASLWPGGAPA